ncbi:MAG: hypothetical protein JRN21_09650 [Nitrososphaerota archaeon]|nr:hypothetical protein [Nitrososphaerota archaeon]
MQSSNETKIRYGTVKTTKESDFDAPDSWQVFDKGEVVANLPDGSAETLFYERWTSKTKQGLAAYRMIGTGYRCNQGHVHPFGEVYYLLKEYTEPVNAEWKAKSVKHEFVSETDLRTAMSCVMEGWDMVPKPANTVEEAVPAVFQMATSA